ALAAEKRKIFTGADKHSVAIVGNDCVWNDFLLDGYPGQVRFFGKWGVGGWDSFEDCGAEGFRLVRKGVDITFRLPGVHNLMNAMAAVEAALAMGAPESSIVRGLGIVNSLPGRSEIVKGPVTVLRDGYNANPESLNAAFKLFSSLKTTGRRILVLGEMLELGDETDEALRLAGVAAAEMNSDSIFLLGESLEALKNAAISAGYSGKVGLYAGMEELQKDLSEYLKAGDLVLLKGSRGSALERLNEIIREVSSG
ncbi:MAG: hypothetical protein KAH21_01135, partial [Spirochaetaceae bacterium]|nr:hypothetical protein [Spirochaetaceae bacterium]